MSWLAAVCNQSCHVCHPWSNQDQHKDGGGLGQQSEPAANISEGLRECDALRESEAAEDNFLR
jgi:hypothetical protein